jgi:recombination protein RecT
MRQEKLLTAQREPVAPRPASTLILLRDGKAGLQVLMTRRNMKASFAPGAFVFPGGVIDPEDGEIASDKKRCEWRDDQKHDERESAVAAIREAFEELGVLIGADPRAYKRNLPLAPQLAAKHKPFQAQQLYAFSHWVTDRDMGKRFDVLFFAALMPDRQQPVADEAEQFEPTWVSPRDALEKHEQGEFSMIFPTVRTLRELARYAQAQDVIDACIAKPLSRIDATCPRGGFVKGVEERFQEFELPYGELEFVSPDGQIGHKLDWQHETPVALRRNIARLTAPNASMMTGPGTNTYLIGELNEHGQAIGPVIVVDPGPLIPHHIERIADAVGARTSVILCTHSHPDHSPAAKPLQELLASRHGTHVQIVGLSSNPESGYELFIPDRNAINGECFKVGNTTLEVIFTPGHASNHLCLLMVEDEVLISGDHILSGSTPVIAPPDGDMSEYLASLERLMLRDIDYIAPAHGHIINNANVAMRKLKEHRLARERKVMASLTRKPEVISAMVANVYDDVSKSLHMLATRSLLAHLLKLEKDGQARRLAPKDGETMERWERV